MSSNPQRPILAASAVIFRGHRVLLVQRGQELGRGLWSLPGGKVEHGERTKAAASREVMEETGAILPKSRKLLAAQDILVPDAGLHVVRLTYLVQFESSVTLSEEHSDFSWLSLEEILKAKIDPYLREVLERL